MSYCIVYQKLSQVHLFLPDDPVFVFFLALELCINTLLEQHSGIIDITECEGCVCGAIVALNPSLIRSQSGYLRRVFT